jgi:NAD(P)H dehydrogenase (quinone)
MAEAVAEGALEIPGTEVLLRRVPETLPQAVLEKTGASGFQKSFAHVPICTPDELTAADAVIFGTPTRFGNMCGQMRQFFDATGGIWKAGALVGNVGSVFTSSATRHGGAGINDPERSYNPAPSWHDHRRAPPHIQRARIDEMTGCSPYGASTIAGNDGSPRPGETELAGARFPGRYVAQIAAKPAA